MLIAIVLVLSATPLERAQAFEADGNDGKAISELMSAIAAEPKWSLGRVELGRLQLKQGNADAAMVHLDVARTLTPENPRAHYLFALAADDAGRRNEARRSLEVALSLRDDYADAQARLGNILLVDGEFDRAADLLGRYAAAHPESNGARLQYAEALERAGRAKEAEAQLRALLDMPQIKTIAGRRLIALLDTQGRTSDAEKVRHKIDPPKRQLRELKPSRH